ncbi:MAG: hypothetical protein H6R17_1461 [Proteobacteria bacterium]|nr:hypothetical protein [Pseudomonadota bacterium]
MISRKATESSAPAESDTAWTVASVRQDFVDWRQGRSRYAVWAIRLDLPSLCAASARMRRHLADYLLPRYDRQPHITLRICGFPGPDQGLGDDYTPATFGAQIEFLERALLRPFSIAVGGPATFPSAAYFSVRDDEGGIARIQQALVGDGPGEKDFPYVPHVTFGLYRGRFRVAEVLQRMRSCPDPISAQFTISELVLMTYQASVITGPLTACCAFDLEQQGLRILDASAMGVLLR